MHGIGTPASEAAATLRAEPGQIHGERLPEKFVEHQILQLRLPVVSRLDVVEKTRTDDAPAAPHQRNPAVIELPAVIFLRRRQQREALRISADLGGVKRGFEIGQRRGPVDPAASIRLRAAAPPPARAIRRRRSGCAGKPRP